MECNRCHAVVDSEEEKEHLGHILCEDCYMEVRSPLKTCDPWAVHSAKSFGQAAILTSLQAEILQILKETGAIEPSVLLQKLGGSLTLSELEREFSALRHMEKVRGKKDGNRIVWLLWNQ